MEPVTTAALIGAGSQLVGQGANAFAQGKMNKKTRQWNEKMYQLQKDDNLANWERQNSYNSPQAQMARLQAAGLNPNLVYGQGAVANSTSAPDTPHAMPYKPEAPNFDVPNVVDGYFNTQMKHQQISNQKKQGDLLAMEALIKSQDLRSKTLLNDYMSGKGYIYKGEKERHGANLEGEKLFAQMLLNAYNQGGGESNDHPDLAPDGAYSLQLRGMDLINKLRRSEMTGKGYRNTIDKTRSQYMKRTMSGELKDMSAKDIMTLLIQGIGLTK